MAHLVKRLNCVWTLAWTLVLTPAVTHSQVAFDSATANLAHQKLEIIRVTPQGKSVAAHQAQLAVKFNQPMVATGQHGANTDVLDVVVTPNLACEWRWLDSSTVVCHLNDQEKLLKASQYEVKVNRAQSQVSDATLASPKVYHFTTNRPKVSRLTLMDWSNVGYPVIHLWFDQAVTRQSVIKSLSFSNGRGQRLANVDIPEKWNPLSDAMFAKFSELGDFEELPYVHAKQQGANLDKENEKRRSAVAVARRYWRIVPTEKLPADTSVTLVMAASVSGIEGPLMSVRDDNLHRFQSLPKFRYLGLECTSFATDTEIQVPPSTSNDDSLRVLNEDRSVANQMVAGCDPQREVSLMFSVPVTYEVAGESLEFSPDLSGGDLNYKPWSTRSNDYQARRFLNSRFDRGRQGNFKLPLPERLKAFERYSLISNEKLSDYFGRRLEDTVDMGFLTSHRRPNLDMFYSHSVFESKVDSELPAFVTNLDELIVKNYRTTTASGSNEPLTLIKPLDSAEDISYRVPVGVRDLLNGASGAVHGFLSSDPLTKQYGQLKQPEFFSQVTPFHVHVKFGHFSSTAWVTDLASGVPVEGAQVTIELDTFQQLGVADSEAGVLTDAKGLATLPGLSELDPQRSHVNEYGFNSPRWFVKVKKGDDLAFLPLDSHYEAWSKVWPYLRNKNGHMHAWGFTAQGVYKAGDQIDFKIFVRDQSNRHWVTPPLSDYSLKVVDPKGQTVHEVEDVNLSDFGTYAGHFSTPTTASVGWYDIQLIRKTGDRSQTFYPMRVLVSDFTPAPFKAENSLNGDLFEAGDTVMVNSFATMHAGGPYASAEARVTAILAPRAFMSDHPEAAGFRFSYAGGRARSINQNVGMLNAAGEWKSEFELPENEVLYGRLKVETAVRDDRGKYIASTSLADFIGRDRFVGLKSDRWLYSTGKTAKFQFIVTDPHGQPIADHEVKLVLQRQETRASRVKGAGNAYLTNYSQKWVEAGRCTKRSLFASQSCRFTPEKAGYHRIVATAKDSKGRDITNVLHSWVTGSNAVVWGDQNTNSVDIVADQADYKVGDTAKFLIKNPYPNAQALITVERYGILRTWQQTLEGSTPVIEVPIQADDHPGFYLSVVIASPRVAAPIGSDALGRDVDLGKPAFKMGYLKVGVTDDTKEIELRIKPNRKVYKPRDTVKLNIKADAKTGPKQEMELAVVVIDESVLSLNAKGKSYYDPYKGFNRLDALGVANYNLLMRLVGRQKFESKGANAGGGGGDASSDLRNLMKFVAYWNPSVKLSKSGKAKLEFELPDNLTGWRVLAIATDKNDRMGLGDVNFKVNKPTELRPVMPNQLNMGDQFTAGFNVLNRTNKPRSLTVDIRATGQPLAEPFSRSQEVELQPYERKTIRVPVRTVAAGELAFYARANDAKDSDAIEYHLPVADRTVIQTQAVYGTTQHAAISESVEFPADILPDVGGVSVVVSPSVLSNIEGAFSYLRDYPYACWEQRLSKGVAASQYNKLSRYLSPEFKWSDSDQLPEKTLSQAVQFQAENGGMSYWINKNDYVSPYLSAYTALSFAWLADQGHEIPVVVEQRLQKYLKRYLRKGRGKTSVNAQRSIAAVALAALAKRGAMTSQELLRYTSWYGDMNLFAKAHFLEAAAVLKLDIGELNGFAQTLLNNSVQSAGKFSFQEPDSVFSPETLSSSTRSNCAVMSALVKVSQASQSSLSLVGDLPFKMARSITQRRGAKLYWANTQENLYCLNSFIEYSTVYENALSQLDVSASFVAERRGENTSFELGTTRFESLRDAPVELSNPALSAQPNLAGDVKIAKTGVGRYYYTVKAMFAKPDSLIEPVNAGIKVDREYSVQREGQWQLLTSPYAVSRGELVRVDLFVSTAGARNFVVIDDPLPGGLEPVNRDLATSSLVDADQANTSYPSSSIFHQERRWRPYGAYGYSFYHQELRHDSARFYSDYLPAGRYHVSYTAQVIADGQFSVKPVKAEEMYDPDVFGMGDAAVLQVGD